MTLRIALVDDQALVREGLKSLLRGLGFHVVLDCEDGTALIADLPSQTVDVVLSDVRMLRMDGIAVTRRLRTAGNAVPIMLLTTFDDADVMLRAIEAGAQAFLLKDISPEDLRDAVLRVASGDHWLAPFSTDAVRRNLNYADHIPPAGELGARDRTRAVLKAITLRLT